MSLCDGGRRSHSDHESRWRTVPAYTAFEQPGEQIGRTGRPPRSKNELDDKIEQVASAEWAIDRNVQFWEVTAIAERLIFGRMSPLLANPVDAVAKTGSLRRDILIVSIEGELIDACGSMPRYRYRPS